MMPKPTMPDFIRTASRTAALMPIGAGADACSPPERANPRIEETVHEIEDEYGDDEEVGVNRCQSDDDGGVELADRVEKELANALVVEHCFRDDRALPGGNQGQGEGRDDRGRRRTEHVLREDRLLRQALRPRGHYEVLVHDLEDQVPGRVRPRPECRKRKGEH